MIFRCVMSWMTTLPIFYEQQSDPAAIHMVAFTAKEPAGREAFTAKWNKIRSDERRRKGRSCRWNGDWQRAELFCSLVWQTRNRLLDW